LKNTDSPGRTRSRPPNTFLAAQRDDVGALALHDDALGQRLLEGRQHVFPVLVRIRVQRVGVFDRHVRRELLARSHAVEVALQQRRVDEGVGGERQRSLQVSHAELAHRERRERQHGARRAADGARHGGDAGVGEHRLEPAVLVAEPHAAEGLLDQRAAEARAMHWCTAPAPASSARTRALPAGAPRRR
jgi:hypothetical protein